MKNIFKKKLNIIKLALHLDVWRFVQYVTLLNRCFQSISHCNHVHGNHTHTCNREILDITLQT